MENIKQGDIIVFKVKDYSYLSRLIGKFTDSNVSHAAMVYQDGKIVEMGSKGIAVNEMEILPAIEDNTYVFRMKSEPTYTPLIESARKHVDAGVKYDFSGLVFIAFIIINKRIIKSPILVKVINMFLKSACIILRNIIEEITGKKRMICSQLVYQIYRDSGKDYEIHFEKRVLSNLSENKDLSENKGSATFRLADLIGDYDANAESYYEDNVEHVDDEDLARQLLTALENIDEKDIEYTLDLSGVFSSADKFMKLLEEIREKTAPDVPLDALFVAPCDFLTTKNLKETAKINIKDNFFHEKC
jgi:hypothetical protein